MTADSGWPPELRSPKAFNQVEEFVRSLETRFTIYIRTMHRLVDVSGDERAILLELQGAVMRGFSALRPEARDEIVGIIGKWVKLADRQTQIVAEATESLLAEDERSRKVKGEPRVTPTGSAPQEERKQ
jgi:hypothetical protein